jgi:hypothetical protein
MVVAYLVFDGEQGPLLVELEQTDLSASTGVIKAGISDRLKDNLAKAQASFDQALASLIRGSVGAFVKAVNALDDVPNQIEVEFGIKATGEVGNLAVGKVSGDTNYTVKLTWSKPVGQGGTTTERNDDTG